MLILESRYRYAVDARNAQWKEEDGTNRKEPTLRMRRLANELVREEREIRYVTK